MSADHAMCTVVPAGEGESHWLAGDRGTIKIDSKGSGGAYMFADIEVVPGGGPPAHVHQREDETVIIVEGTFRFLMADRTANVGAGAVLFMPRGMVHGYQNVGQSEGRILLFAAPGGFEEFVKAAGVRGGAEMGPPPPPSVVELEKLRGHARRFGIELRPDHQAGAGEYLGPQARPYWVLGEHVAIKLTSEETGGQLSLCEVTSQPGGRVPVHAHIREDELFYVLEGTYAFAIEGRAITAGPGTFVQVPKGVMHGFGNVGQTVARMIDIHTPGGFEQFFMDAGCPCTDGNAAPAGPPDMAVLMRLFAKHGMTLAPPQ